MALYPAMAHVYSCTSGFVVLVGLDASEPSLMGTVLSGMCAQATVLHIGFQLRAAVYLDDTVRHR